ncbi:uncharacterized protein TEOVI_000771500 [Trypanosoma equiperdum]|uniref:Uncharacterized protein n=1 Tax=Trypanosoma equiperdum TaxID=5694 RepID=A0A1G4I633_TRYEQ|nr:hypothetical protein, conserved [Trypanosoma equiperdum]
MESDDGQVHSQVFEPQDVQLEEVEERSLVVGSEPTVYSSEDVQSVLVNVPVGGPPSRGPLSEFHSVEEISASSERSRDVARSAIVNRLVSPLPTSPLKDRSVVEISEEQIRLFADESHFPPPPSNISIRTSRSERAPSSSHAVSRFVSSPSPLRQVVRRYVSPQRHIDTPLINRRASTPIRRLSTPCDRRLVSPVDTPDFRERRGRLNPQARMSPTLVVASSSLPEDESSADSLVIVPTYNRKKRRVCGGRSFPTLYNISSLLVQFDGVWASSDDEEETSRNIAGSVALRRAAGRYRNSPSPITPVASGAVLARQRCRTGPLIEALQSVRNEKDMLMIMEKEQRDRRKITKAYVRLLREMLLWCAVKHATVLARGGPGAQSCKLRSQAGAVGRANSVPTRTSSSRRGERVRTCPIQRMSPLRTPREEIRPPLLSCGAQLETDVPVVGQGGRSRNDFSSHSQEKEKKGPSAGTYQSVSGAPAGSWGVFDSPVQGGRQGSFSRPSPDRLCSTSMDRSYEIWEVKAQLRSVVSEELGKRILVIGAESAAFQFIVHYHRIELTAFQREPIYLQEACQRRSIVSEAKNQLRMISDRGSNMGILGHLNWVEEWAQRLLTLIESERYVRQIELYQAEGHEREEIQRVFSLGLKSLTEYRECEAKRRRCRLEMKDIALCENLAREKLVAEEIQSRAALHLTYSAIPSSVVASGSDRRVGVPRRGAQKGSCGEHSHISPRGTEDPSRCYDRSLVTEPESHASTTQDGSAFTSALSAAMCSRNTSNNRALSDSDTPNEVVFFVWDPTSNTLTRTSNNNFTSFNTSTGTTTATVRAPSTGTVAVVRCDRSKSLPEATGSVSKVSSPSPQFPVAGSSTSRVDKSGSFVSAPLRGSAAAARDQVSEIPRKAGHSGRRSSSAVLKSCKTARRNDKTPLSGSGRRPSRVPNAARADGGKTNRDIFKRPINPVEEAEATFSLANRHIVPCSLKAAVARRGGSTCCFNQFSGEPFPDLRSTTQRPYNDDIIYSNSSRGFSEIDFGELSSAGEEEVKVRGDTAAKVHCGVSGTPLQSVTTVTISLDSDDAEDGGHGGQGNSNAAAVSDDRVEVGSITTEFIFESVRDEDDDVDPFSMRTVGKGSNSDSAAGKNVGPSLMGSSKAPFESAERSPTSTPMPRQESRRLLSHRSKSQETLTIPDVSLSTMHDETIGSGFKGEAAGRASLRSGCSSSPRFGESTLSASTALNTDEAGNKKRSCKGGPSRGSSRRPAVNRPKVPPGYLRPTAGWKRQSEEKVWQQLFSEARAKHRVSASRPAPINPRCPRDYKSDRKAIKVARVPYEEGPGVWSDYEEPRQPYGPIKVPSDARYGRKPEGRCVGGQSGAATIISPVRRRDAVWRFKAEGSCCHRSTSSLRDAKLSRDESSNALTNEGTALDEEDMDALKGIVRRASTTSHRTVASVASTPKKACGSSFYSSRSVTPSYIEAFYKLDLEAAKRYGFLISSHSGPVLQSTTPSKGGKKRITKGKHLPQPPTESSSSELKLSPDANSEERLLSTTTTHTSMSHILYSPRSKHHC